MDKQEKFASGSAQQVEREDVNNSWFAAARLINKINRETQGKKKTKIKRIKFLNLNKFTETIL